MLKIQSFSQFCAKVLIAENQFVLSFCKRKLHIYLAVTPFLFRTRTFKMNQNTIPKEEPGIDNISSEFKPNIQETNSVSSLPITPDQTSSPRVAKRAGRRKINIEFIEDKSRRHITFSKRKAGIMKKAYELSTLTGTQVLLLVASETGHVYTFATPKLQPLITKPEGKNLIQACLNAPDSLQAQSSHPQMSPGTPSGYSHQNEHMSMNQPDYGNHNQSPVQSYGQPPSVDHDDKSSMGGYGMQRNSFADLKNYQTPSPSQDHDQPSSMGYSYANQHVMNSNAMRMPYHSGAPLPTLSDRGSFSNLNGPNNPSPYHYQPSQPGMPSFSSMGDNSFPSHFPSGSSQLFSKASNLPTISRHDNL